MGKLLLLSFLSIAYLSSCKPRGYQLSESGPMDRAAWINKASKSLRGVNLSPEEDMGALLQKSDDEVLDYFMADDQFDAVMAFFGRKYFGRTDRFDPNNVFAGMDFVPQASAAARALRDGEDFFQLVSNDPTIIVTNVSFPSAVPLLPPGLSAKDLPNYAQIVRNAREASKLGAIAAIDAVISKAGNDNDLFCRLVSGLSENNMLASAGLDQLGGTLMYTWGNTISATCTQAQDIPKVLKMLSEMKQAINAIYDGMANHIEPRGYRIRDGAKIRLNLPTLGPLQTPYNGIASETWQYLPNTFTNLNRKRAAYALKTFFCDDLIPLEVPNIAAPQHNQGKHASDPACRACHYKLDPMAALFRNYGAMGNYFPTYRYYSFADNRTMQAAEFEAFKEEHWGSEAKGTLVAGYYTAPGVKHPLWQGDELSDLWSFAQRAPEARQCMIKRLSSFFLDDQIVDQNWLDSISKDVVAGPKSGVAVKAFIKRLITSNTFKQFDPNPGECFDQAPRDPTQDTAGTNTSMQDNALPCAVRAIVSEKCLGCHKDDLNDLSFNSRNTDGSWFKHTNGPRMLSKAESAQIIMERINGVEGKSPMPPDGALNDLQRQAIYSWFSEAKNEAL